MRSFDCEAQRGRFQLGYLLFDPVDFYKLWTVSARFYVVGSFLNENRRVCTNYPILLPRVKTVMSVIRFERDFEGAPISE